MDWMDMLNRYPISWDEPYTPPPTVDGELRDLLVEVFDRMQAMSAEQKQAMYEAGRESFVLGMTTPCEHGELDFEQCGECRSQ